MTHHVSTHVDEYVKLTALALKILRVDLEATI